MREQDTEVTIFDGEELLAVTETGRLSPVLDEVSWLSPLNLGLGVITFGLWYVVPLARAASSADVSPTEYVITDERIVESSGLVGSSTTQYDFEKLVGDIHTEQGTVQGLLGTGDIIFEVQKTRATTETTGNIGERGRSQKKRDVRRETITLENVSDHDEVADTIRRIHRR